MKPVLGVFGGMFDPVHDGHLQAAHFLIDILGLQRIVVVPCGIPNHRETAASSGEHRMNMLRLAMAEIPQAEICDYEVNKQGISYSVDTLAWLKQSNPDSRLIFLMGIDAFNGLPGWHNWQRILTLSNLMVLPRSGESVAENVESATDLARRAVRSPSELLASDAGAIWLDASFDFDISSTTVRRQLQSGGRPGCVQESVLGYIKEHRLYGQG
ncbi:MAG: nicotinate (nicotinamide) nucleotide adenylyltransferase [Gammaproteobacteria bacterium]